MQSERQLDVGVIGVGSMGKNHARVYGGLPAANLVGVFDVEEDRATAVASEYGASPMGLEDLLASVDAVSIAVPTAYHHDVATRCIDARVAMLIEKPIVEDPEIGRKLQSEARAAGVPIQVGHIERFNPAVRTLEELIDDLSIVSISTKRLGPPPEREIGDSAVLDLMIHDVDVVLSLLDAEPTAIRSSGVNGNRHAAALLEFDSGTMASLTASRLTQRKVRTLEVIAEECLVELDYIDQSIEIHRQSIPEYVANNGDIRFRHESLIERPHISNEEPLRAELASFIEAVASNEPPQVTIGDGITALEIAQRIEALGDGDQDAVDIEVRND
jgi:predicted dehydrogenase